MKAKCCPGFTLVEIMIVVAIVGLLASIALPSFMNARTVSMKNTCIDHLRQLDGAVDQYALFHGVKATDINDFVPEIFKRVPTCPANGSYDINTIPVSCSLSAQGHKLQ